MRGSMIVLCCAAIGLAACNPSDSGGNAAEAGNEAASANAAGTVDSGGAPAAGVNAAAAPAAETVSFQGCPILRDVEGGCLVVESDGVTYDINSARPRPDHAQGVVIQGTGTPGGVSICMTGTVLTDIKWQYTKMKCPDGGKE